MNKQGPNGIGWLSDKLKSWPGEMALTSGDIADLIAILSDHEAALPLLDEIEQAGMISNTKKHPGNYLHFIETDAEKILGSAMTWKNRPGAYKERSQPND